jgi:hypothetical protein
VTTVSRRLINQLSLKKEAQHIVSIEINSFVDAFIADFEQKIDDFKKELEGFFQDSSSQLFSKTTFEMQLTKEKVKQAIGELVKTSQYNLDISLKSNLLFISRVDDIREKGIVELIFALNEQLFPNPFLLPAERNAFIITYKMLANRRFNLLKDNRRELFINRDNAERQLEILKEQSGDIRYPKPIEDFLDFLTDAELMSSAPKTEFQQLADNIERYILSQNKIYYKPTLLAGKEIKIEVNRGLAIDLYNASSAIKQLTPLLLYLRYRAKKNDLLIIDEPEMNLHPESQAKLLEVFGILVNCGVNVLLTTHSPYFMDHLNSLVSGKPDVLKKQAKALYLKDDRAFVSFESVSAYEMRDNQLHSLKDEDEDIRWDTLSDVSHELQHKYFQIYERGKASIDPQF